MDENPLLSDTLFPRFDAVQASHVVPGIRYVLAESERELEELEKSLEGLGEAVTVSFLLPALERLTDRLGKTWGICSHLKAVKDSEARRKAVEEVQPEKVAFGLKIAQSEHIYRAFKHIRESKAWPTLTEAQQRIVESEIRDAELAGVALTGASKERFNEIQKRLAQLSTDFSNNVLDATKAFSVRLTKKEEVDGLPPSALALSAQSAKSKGDEGATAEDGPWLITLDFPSYMPVMQYAKDRSLREKMYKAYLTRASELGHSDGSKNIDNTPLIKEILELRKEKAALLGKKHHAEVSMASKMATLETALKLMQDLRGSCYSGACQELKDLQAFAETKGFSGTLMPWDVTFYAEALREEQYAFNQEELRPYFSLPRVLQGMFGLAKRLFDVDVVPYTDAEKNPAPLWHPDVQFWQINRNGEPAAYFYLDAYSRPEEKRDGAWMSDVVGRSTVMAPPGKGVRLPVAHMVCNQAEGMVAGTSGIEWDAIEEPSQFMENWCYDKATIDGMAVHYETGAPIPAELWAKVKAAKNFRAATMMLRQLYFAVTDLTLHSTYDPAGPQSVHELMREISKTYQVLAPMEYDRFLCGFSHIFAGGYSAGYFSYLWAEVLSADCFSAFEDAGLDNEEAVRATGRRFRDTVLSLGGGVAPAKVFEMFRGRPPAADALLRHSGLVASSG